MFAENNVPEIKKGAFKGVSLVEAHEQNIPTMRFTIYGFEKQQVDKSKAGLEKKCKDRYQNLEVEKKIIQMLTEREVSKLI